jgi:hypothetical protein
MSSQPHSSLTPPDEFRHEKFTKQAGLRDYLVYLLVAVFLATVIGAAGYYLTRSEAEQKRIVARLRGITGENEPKMKPVKLREPSLEEPAEPAAVPPPKAEAVAPTGSASAYAGGRVSRVLPSEDPQRPAASPEFIRLAEGLKVSGVLQGNPARAMLNGRMFRVGDEIDPGLAVMLAGVDATKKFLLLRDKSGAELRLTY